MTIELTIPVCTVHQRFMPCPPCAKQAARLRVQTWSAVGWVLLFGAFFGVVLWFAGGGR